MPPRTVSIPGAAATVCRAAFGAAMTTSTFASDGWYAIGGSDELAPGAVMPATILDRELVVWRDSGGGVSCLGQPLHSSRDAA